MPLFDYMRKLEIGQNNRILSINRIRRNCEKNSRKETHNTIISDIAGNCLCAGKKYEKINLCRMHDVGVALGGSAVFAGDVPEELMNEDFAKIFLAEVVSYNDDTANPELVFSAVRKIKGDVIIRSPEQARDPSPVGDFEVIPGEVYLFAYLNEANPTYVFEVTTDDPKTMKIKNAVGDMWERFEEALNDGKYEEAEAERCERLGLISTLSEDADVSVPDEKKPYKNVLIFGGGAIVLAAAICTINKMRKRRKTK